MDSLEWQLPAFVRLSYKLYWNCLKASPPDGLNLIFAIRSTQSPPLTSGGCISCPKTMACSKKKRGKNHPKTLDKIEDPGWGFLEKFLMSWQQNARFARFWDLPTVVRFPLKKVKPLILSNGNQKSFELTQLKLVVEIPLFTGFLYIQNSGWSGDFWTINSI